MFVRPKNNYHPLRFHDVHGKKIKLSKNKTVACRSEGFSDGIIFSDRPVAIRESVYVKILETSPNFSGALRIGFTMNDPVSLKSNLPEYACPDLTSMHGNWAKAIGEKHAKKDSVISFYVDESGDVHYGIGVEKFGIIFGGVNTSVKLWTVLDIYGNTVAVEFLNQEYADGCNSNSASFQTKERTEYKEYSRLLSFHSTHGKNVILKGNKFIASKKAATHSLAYVFTERPVEMGKTIKMVVTQIDHYCEGLLVYGLTSCNPKKIKSYEFPENVYDLLDRSEYWIVKKKSYPYEVGDTITVTLDNQGLVEVIVNGDADSTFLVDYRQPLWFFLNLTHSVAELKLQGVFSTECNQDVSSHLFRNLSLADTNEDESGKPGTSGHQQSSECVICCVEQIDCALYRCGHMCMCYNCASKVMSTSTAHCPICRSSIQDIIKIYK